MIAVLLLLLEEVEATAATVGDGTALTASKAVVKHRVQNTADVAEVNPPRDEPIVKRRPCSPPRIACISALVPNRRRISNPTEALSLNCRLLEAALEIYVSREDIDLPTATNPEACLSNSALRDTCIPRFATRSPREMSIVNDPLTTRSPGFTPDGMTTKVAVAVMDVVVKATVDGAKVGGAVGAVEVGETVVGTRVGEIDGSIVGETVGADDITGDDVCAVTHVNRAPESWQTPTIPPTVHEVPLGAGEMWQLKTPPRLPQNPIGEFEHGSVDKHA